MRRVWLRSNPPFACHFGCGRELLDKYSRLADGWQWFTGYGDGPIHFCPACRHARQHEIDSIRLRANVRPPNYPDERIKL